MSTILFPLPAFHNRLQYMDKKTDTLDNISPGDNRVMIIAEAGVNHNGSLDTAREMVRVAAQAGADMVKFQTFKADKLVTRTAAKAEYQQATTGMDQSQYEMIKALELDVASHEALIQCCRDNGILFLSTAFELDSIGLLAELGQKIWKNSIR